MSQNLSKFKQKQLPLTSMKQKNTRSKHLKKVHVNIAAYTEEDMDGQS